jgi:hypothetical protein
LKACTWSVTVKHVQNTTNKTISHLEQSGSVAKKGQRRLDGVEHGVGNESLHLCRVLCAGEALEETDQSTQGERVLAVLLQSLCDTLQQITLLLDSDAPRSNPLVVFGVEVSDELCLFRCSRVIKNSY